MIWEGEFLFADGAYEIRGSVGSRQIDRLWVPLTFILGRADNVDFKRNKELNTVKKER